MQKRNWMIYGATGTYGKLIAEAAAKKGYKPVLAGRSADKLRTLAEKLDLPYKVLDLADGKALRQALAGMALVLNTAGPFETTSQPLVEACLAQSVSYLDIANEVAVFDSLYARDQQARAAKIAIIPGVGYGTVAADFLIKSLVEQLSNPVELEIAMYIYTSQSSPGVAKTTLTVLAEGAKVYQNGKLTQKRLGAGAKELRFPDQPRAIMPISIGNLASAYQLTRIPNIRVLVPAPGRFTRLALPLINQALKFGPVWRLATKLADRPAKPAKQNEVVAKDGHCYTWAKLTDANGQTRSAWQETGDGLEFTVVSSLYAVEQVLEHAPIGAMSPAQAFGADFVNQIPSVRQYESF